MTLIQQSQIQPDPNISNLSGSFNSSGQYLLTLIPSINGIVGGPVVLSGVSPISVFPSGQNVVISGNFSNFTQNSQTGLFYPKTNPSGYILSSQTGVLQPSGNYLNSAQSGLFYPNTNPSGFIPSGNIIAGSGIQIIQSGNFLVVNCTGSFGNGNGGTGIFITGLSPFNINVSGAYTIPLPSGAFLDGSRVVYRIIQPSTGHATITLASGYRLPSSSSNPLPFSTSGNFMDIFAAMYNGLTSGWDVVSFVPGYN